MNRTINCCSTFSDEADSEAHPELADAALASSPACSRGALTPLSEAGITDRKLCIAGFRGVLGIPAVVLIPASANETLSYPHSPITILKLLVYQFLYVECLACMYVSHMCTWCAQVTEEDVISFGTRVTSYRRLGHH